MSAPAGVPPRRPLGSDPGAGKVGPSKPFLPRGAPAGSLPGQGSIDAGLEQMNASEDARRSIRSSMPESHSGSASIEQWTNLRHIIAQVLKSDGIQNSVFAATMTVLAAFAGRQGTEVPNRAELQQRYTALAQEAMQREDESANLLRQPVGTSNQTLFDPALHDVEEFFRNTQVSFLLNAFLDDAEADAVQHWGRNPNRSFASPIH